MTLARNFLRNLKSPALIGNELLQGDLKGAGNASARAMINTLAGFGGILDLASEGGIPYEKEDFGQTLAVWGVALQYTRWGGTVLSERERLIDIIDDLRRNSFDYYAVVRSAYHQNRQALINDKANDTMVGPDIPDYDEN